MSLRTVACWGTLAVAGLLAAGCQKPEDVAVSETPPAPTAPVIEPAPTEPAPSALDDPVYVDNERNLRYRFPPVWERYETSKAFPQAAFELRHPETDARFAVVRVELAGVLDDPVAARQVAIDYFKQRAQVIKVDVEKQHSVSGLTSRFTLAEGLIEGSLARVADHLLLTSDGFYHLATWAPLLSLDSEELTQQADSLAAGFDLPDPSTALQLEAVGGLLDAEAEVKLLNFDVIDAAYSAGVDRLILVSSEPPALHLVEPRSMAVESIELERVPLNLALTPDGSQAAVGHAGRLSLVNLAERRLVTSRPVKQEPADLVFTGDGWVYMLPTDYGWSRLVGVRLPGSTEVESGGASVTYHGGAVALHPDGDRIYVATRGSSPDKIKKVDISDGTPRYLYEWRYHGEHSACGDLWIAADGRTIYSACGNVVRSSRSRDHDMTFDGKIAGVDFVQSLVEIPARQRLALVAGSAKRRNQDRLVDSSEVRIHHSRNLTLERTDTMPEALVAESKRKSLVRFLAAPPDGSEYYAVVLLPAGRDGRNAWGLVTRDL